ncbi:9983_t:CDS:2, partial [Acaulospora colombiana]
DNVNVKIRRVGPVYRNQKDQSGRQEEGKQVVVAQSHSIENVAEDTSTHSTPSEGSFSVRSHYVGVAPMFRPLCDLSTSRVFLHLITTPRCFVQWSLNPVCSSSNPLDTNYLKVQSSYCCERTSLGRRSADWRRGSSTRVLHLIVEGSLLRVPLAHQW